MFCICVFVYPGRAEADERCRGDGEFNTKLIVFAFFYVFVYLIEAEVLGRC